MLMPLVAAGSTEELFLLLCFFVREAHAFRVVPLIALITFDIKKVGVEGLHAGAERLPS